MESIYLPSSLEALLFNFAPCFTGPSLANFQALVGGWILAPARHWISRAVVGARCLGYGGHHSTLYRFLSRARWSPDALGRVLFGLLLPFLPKEITVPIDDTLCHRTGSHIFGVGVHVDLSRSSYQGRGRAGRFMAFTRGVDWVVLAVWVPLPWSPRRGMALPLLARMYRTRRTCRRGEYRKRTELARELIGIFLSWLPKGRTAHFCGDDGYACGPVVRDLDPAAHFTGRMDMTAALFGLPPRRRRRGRPSKKGERLRSPAQMTRRGGWRRVVVEIYGKSVELLAMTQVCLWPTVAGARPVRLVLTRDPRGRYDDRAYFTTAIDLSAEEVLQAVARRWPLEVAFRNLKQAFGLEDPQNGWARSPGRCLAAEASARRTVPLVFMAYSVSVLWYLEHGKPASDVAWVRAIRPWQRKKREPSFDDMLCALRREIWAHRISGGPGEHTAPAKTRALLAMLNSAA